LAIEISDIEYPVILTHSIDPMLEIFTPKLAAELLPEIYVGRITLKDGVRRFLTSIPASQYPAILDYAKTQPMRSVRKDAC
jgi:2-hydroxy-3-keto-5-methylthiopentenyl-1-phosphate phosphatase